jgi:hypothetical protein
MKNLRVTDVPQRGDWFVLGLQRFVVQEYDSVANEVVYIKDYAHKDDPQTSDFTHVVLLDKKWPGHRYWINADRVHGGKKILFNVSFPWVGGKREVLQTQAVSMRQARVNSLHVIGVRWCNSTTGGQPSSKAKAALAEIKNSEFDWDWLIPSLALKN